MRLVNAMYSVKQTLRTGSDYGLWSHEIIAHCNSAHFLKEKTSEREVVNRMQFCCRESSLFTLSMEVTALFCLRCITDDLFTMIYLFILLEQWRNTRWEADECFRWGLLPNQTYPLGILTLVSVAYIHNAAASEMRPQLRRNGRLIMG